jgi:multidrug efflux pump subunit AcrB
MLDITIKREVASSYGIMPYAIDNTLDDAFGQRIVSTMAVAQPSRAPESRLAAAEPETSLPCVI